MIIIGFVFEAMAIGTGVIGLAALIPEGGRLQENEAIRSAHYFFV